MSEISLDRKAPDSLGRVKAFSHETLNADAFGDYCGILEYEARETGATRWSLRSLIARNEVRTEDLLRVVLPTGEPLEVNRLQVQADGREQDYLWVSRNLGDRVPSPAAREEFLGRLAPRVAGQEETFAHYNSSAGELLDRAADAGWYLVCNDPVGDWGQGQVDPVTFRSLMQQYFWFQWSEADLMLQGEGYSTHGHYTFALNGPAGETLCVFVLARFAWGFEGTYTMVNPMLPARRTTGAVRVLMLLANALVLDRHGPETLLYGEANPQNVRACIAAGYAVVPPRGCEPSSLVNENIVWADNPIGEVRELRPELQTPQPPGHREAKYVSYALMRARNPLVMPYTDRAHSFLHR